MSARNRRNLAATCDCSNTHGETARRGLARPCHPACPASARAHKMAVTLFLDVLPCQSEWIIKSQELLQSAFNYISIFVLPSCHSGVSFLACGFCINYKWDFHLSSQALGVHLYSNFILGFSLNPPYSWNHDAFCRRWSGMVLWLWHAHTYYMHWQRLHKNSRKFMYWKAAQQQIANIRRLDTLNHPAASVQEKPRFG